MEFLSELWLPILLSAVIVFVASSIIHMAIPLHKNDVKQLPGEEAVMAAMRAAGVGPGEYMFPRACSMKEMGTPEMMAKFSQGPVGVMAVLPNGPFHMGKSLTQWFIYCIVISIIAGYLAHATLPHGADYLAVFRVTGTAAFLAYAMGTPQNSIWKGQGWVTTGKFLFDGLVYGLVTAGTFGWLWPGL